MHTLRTHRTLITLLLIGVFFSVPLVTNAVGLSDIVITVTGWALYVGASLFNKALELFVLGMGKLITGQPTQLGQGSFSVGLGVSIDVIWKTVRDLVNLSFIFGLIYVGFKTILDAGTDTKKMLSQIIICALLVNFSLFITKVVIDVSNVTSNEIYKAMKIAPSATQGTASGSIGISDAFLARMGLIQLVSLPHAGETVTTEIPGRDLGKEGYLPFTIGAGLFILVSAFVFFAGAVLITIRFGVLVLLMMLSPIAFAAWVFPALKSWSEEWRHTLLSQAFFAPAYLFMLYITLKLADGYQNATGAADGIYTTKLFNEGYTSIAFFSLTIVMMVSSLVLAKKMGAFGAAYLLNKGKAMATGVRRTLTRGALAPLKATSGFAGRTVLGRLGVAGQKLNARLDTTRRGRFAKTIVGGLLGTPTERGRQERLEKMQKGKYGGSYSHEENIQFENKRVQAREQEQRRQNISAAIAASTGALPGSQQMIDLEHSIAGASDDHIISMLKGKSKGNPEYDALVSNMSEKQLDAVMKARPEEINDGAKEALKTDRGQSITVKLQNEGKTADDTQRQRNNLPLRDLTDAQKLSLGIKNANASQLKALGLDELRFNAENLTQSQFDAIMASTDYSPTEKALIREERTSKLFANFTANPAGFFAELKDAHVKAEDIAKLPRSILTSTFAIPFFTKGMLIEMRRTLDDYERAQIRTDIEGLGNSHIAYDWLTSARGQDF